jgi:ferrochelatase
MGQQHKTGVLLVNLGTPDQPVRSAVYRYLKEFLLDRRVIDIPAIPRNILVRGIIAPFRSGSSAKLYKEVWTEKGSPLLLYGLRLKELIAERLGDDFKVALGMRYQNPSIKSALDELLDAQVDEVIVLPLFPQYASATSGSVIDEVMRIMRKDDTILPVKFVNSFYDNEKMIKVFAKNARKFDLESYDQILFSYHGLPQRQLRKGDRTKSHCLKVENCCSNICDSNKFCYSAQCHATTALIAKELGLHEDQYETCFQSRLGKDPWTQPYTINLIEEVAKNDGKRILVFSPAFVADCLETLVEISVEYQEEFEEMGGEQVDLVASLNDDPDWIEAVEEIIKSNI